MNKFKVKSEILIFDDFGDFGGFFTILWSGASASPDLDNNYIGRYNWFFQSKWLFSELRWSCESVRMIYRVGNPGRTNLRVLRELSDHSGKRFCHYIGFCSLCPTDIIMTYTSSLTFLLTFQYKKIVFDFFRFQNFQNHFSPWWKNIFRQIFFWVKATCLYFRFPWFL